MTVLHVPSLLRFSLRFGGLGVPHPLPGGRGARGRTPGCCLVKGFRVQCLLVRVQGSGSRIQVSTVRAME